MVPNLINTSDLGLGAAHASSRTSSYLSAQEPPSYKSCKYENSFYLSSVPIECTYLDRPNEHFVEVQIHPWSFSISSTFSVSSLTMGLPKWPSMSSFTFSAAGPSILMETFFFQQHILLLTYQVHSILSVGHHEVVEKKIIPD